MKVLLISHTCQSRSEGQPKAQELGKLSGIDLCVLSPDRWMNYGRWRAAEYPTEPSFRFKAGKIRWPSLGPAQSYLHWYPKLGPLLKSFQPDVIDLWEEPWGLVSAHTCGLRNHLLPNTKIISETEQNIEKKLPFPFERFRSYTLRNADYAIGRSAEAVDVLRRKGYKGPAEVVPNAVDAETFRPMNAKACRDALGLSGFVVGYVGRLVEEKGIEDILDALLLCPDRVNLLIVGQSTPNGKWENRVKLRGLEPRVRFLGARPSCDLPGIINAMNVLVLPSRTTRSWKEQFGRVVIEAHACGVPVIGSDSGAIPEVIDEGGIIVPERNSTALAAAIRRLSDNPELAKQMGHSGRLQVEANYTWKRVAERMRDIYLKVTDSVPATEAVCS